MTSHFANQNFKNEIVLDIDNLSFSYNKRDYIYKDFSLTLKRGEIISMVGESGSGKTTLFNLITNDLKLQNGTIKTARVSEVFQDPYSSFSKTYTILNQIQDVASTEKLDLYLQRLNLTKDLILKKPSELSGGQLQRASILRAMLYAPDLLLLDEPTSALDNITSLDVMRFLLDEMKSFGILLITHDAHLAQWCSDKTITLDS